MQCIFIRNRFTALFLASDCAFKATGQCAKIVPETAPKIRSCMFHKVSIFCDIKTVFEGCTSFNGFFGLWFNPGPPVTVYPHVCSSTTW